MRPEIIVIVVVWVIVAVADYALLVMASKAEERAERDHKALEKEKRKNEHQD